MRISSSPGSFHDNHKEFEDNSIHRPYATGQSSIQGEINLRRTPTETINNGSNPHTHDRTRNASRST